MKYEKKMGFALFVPGEEGYNTFRIPAVITLPNGRLPAFAEGRRLSASDYGEIDIVVKVSDDGGENWEPERDITESTKPSDWTWYAVGPNHALQLASGRLLFPCNHAVLIENEEKSGPYHSHTIYSDDHGETWQIGEDIGTYTTEDVVVQLKDGRVLINIRFLPCPGCRFMVVSIDDGVTFSEYRNVESQPDPGCQGSMILVERGDQEVILVTNAATVERE